MGLFTSGLLWGGLTCLFLWAPATARAMDMKELCSEVGAAAGDYRFGESRQPLTLVSELIRDSRPGSPLRRMLCDELGKLLKSDASVEAKQFACRQLSEVGTGEDVPILSELLGDETLNHMACYALERIPDAAAGVALRQALPKVSGVELVGVINALGQRREMAAVGELLQRASHSDIVVAKAALDALGKIGGKEAIEGMLDLYDLAPEERRSLIAEAGFIALDRLALVDRESANKLYQSIYEEGLTGPSQTAALIGMVRTGAPDAYVWEIVNGIKSDNKLLSQGALALVREAPGAELTRRATELLPELDEPKQAALIASLTARGDRSALPSVLTAGDKGGDLVAAAAIDAALSLGDASAVAFLTRRMSRGGALAKAAGAALAQLSGEGVDEAILKELERAGDELKTELITLFPARRNPILVPPAIKLAESEDPGIRRAVLNALGALAGADDLPDLLAILINAEEDNDLAAKAFVAVARRTDFDKGLALTTGALKDATGETRNALIMVLGLFGGDEALTLVGAALKEEDDLIRESAIKALCGWPEVTIDVLFLLRDAAEDLAGSRLGTLALRGGIELLGKSALTAAEKVEGYAIAKDLAIQVAEQRLILAGLAKLSGDEALALAESFRNEQLKDDVAAAVSAIRNNQ